jgi:hypothetical protein
MLYDQANADAPSISAASRQHLFKPRITQILAQARKQRGWVFVLARKPNLFALAIRTCQAHASGPKQKPKTDKKPRSHTQW